MHEDDARADIRAAGFWGCRHHCFIFNVHVFNAFAESNQSTSLATSMKVKNVVLMRSMYRKWKRAVLLSSSGDMGKAATVSSFWNSPYSLIIGWVRCSLSFSLLHSSLMCLQGSCYNSSSPSVPAAVDMVTAEGHLATSNEQ